MNQSIPARRALSISLAVAAGFACWPTAAVAQTIPAPPAAAPVPATDDTRRLTDEQRREVLDGITPESAAAARGEIAGSGGIGRGIHGEIGAVIGTHGTRGIYGTAAIPLGDHAGAVVSFETSRFGGYHR